MKSCGTGFLLAWQFFSVIPIKKQLEMNAKSVTWMYAFLPMIGLIIGAIISGGILALSHFSDLSSLLLAILIVIGFVVLTGGLHLDGWIDMSDAFFSYGEKDKRLQILDDPRTGAFGVISVICLVILKIGFIYEILEQDDIAIIPYVLFIPFIARLGMLLYFLTMPTAKKSGLANYFKSVIIGKKLALFASIFCVVVLASGIYFSVYSLIILLFVMLLVVYLYRKWSNKHFGGMSGDLLGALVEGGEVVLWITLLLCI